MKYIFFIGFIFLFLLSCENEDNNIPVNVPESDSLVMGQGYANDVFYSLDDGGISSKSRNTWDIAFRTMAFSSSILINRGAGVQLYEVSKDTNEWANALDTTGYKSWTALNNSVEDWEVGAFSENMTDHPDYGWGKYDSKTHDVNGSAVFMIVLRDGTMKKIFIRKKNSENKIYYFLYSDIDGSNEKSVKLDCTPFIDREYIYYSLINNSVVDEQPAKNTWDLWFTKYFDPSIGNQQIVTGALINPSAKAMKVTGKSHEQADTTMGTFSDSPAVIGYDWKHFNMQTFVYEIPDSITYFVKTSDKDVYKLYFTAFDRSIGKIVFVKEKL